MDGILIKLKRRIQDMDDRIQENLRMQTEKGKNNAQELENVTKAMQVCIPIWSYGS
jgi:hypothetical protein